MDHSASGVGLGLFVGWRDRASFLYELGIDESSSFELMHLPSFTTRL